MPMFPEFRLWVRTWLLYGSVFVGHLHPLKAMAFMHLLLAG